MIKVDRFPLMGFFVLNISERNGLGPGVVFGCCGLGVLMDYIPMLGLAEKYLLRAIDVSETIQTPAAVGNAHGFAGLHSILAGNPKATPAYTSRAREAQREAGNLRDWGYATEIMGSALWQTGKLAEAEQLCKEMLHTGREAFDRQICCWALSKLGHALRRLGKIDEAEEALQESYDLGGTVPDYAMRIEAGAELGRCFLRQGKLTKAISVLEAAQQTYFEHPERWGVSSDLYNALVEAYVIAAEQSDPTLKATYLEKAQRASHTAFELGKGSRSRLPDTMWMRGRYEWLKGKTAAARKWWQKGLELAEKQGERFDLAAIHLEMGQRFKDQAHLEHAERIFSEIGAAWDLARAHEALKELS
jgi:tetratricopeptide (TPR) repeat protein